MFPVNISTERKYLYCKQHPSETNSSELTRY